MDTLFRRQPWVIDLVVIAIVATLAGRAASTLIAAALPSRPPPTWGPTQLPASNSPIGTKTIDAIVDRNIFCSTHGDSLPPESTGRARTLLAIMFAPPPSNPRWSMAVVRDELTATAGPFGVGDRVGDAKILAIEPTHVVLDVGRGRRERLELLGARTVSTAAQGRGPAATFADAVTKTGVHRYEVRRAALEQLLAGGMASWPRVVPDAREGAPPGLRLVGIRADGPFAAIGLADGDRLLDVNDQSIVTPDAALSAYASLRTASHIWLRVQRGRHEIRLDYVIR